MNVARCDGPIATVQPADSGERAAGDDDVVQGVVRWRSGRAPAGQDPRLECHPLVDRVLADDEMGQHGLELARLGHREESDLPEVDPEQGHVDLDHGPGRPQERAVATEDDEHVGRGQLRDERLDVRSLGCPLVDTADGAPAGGALAKLDCGLARGVVSEADPLDRHDAATADDQVGDVRAVRPAMELDEELPVSLGPEDRRRDDSPRTQTQRIGLLHDALKDLAVGFRVSDDPVIGLAAADFELGLHEGDDGGSRTRLERAQDRPEDEPDRDERDVDDGNVDRLREGVGRQGPGVRPLHRDDAFVASQRLGELPAPDVHRVDARGSPLEQDVGETAGRRTNVERDESGGIDREGIQRGRQLVTAAADVRVGLGQRDRGVVRSGGRRP